MLLSPSVVLKDEFLRWELEDDAMPVRHQREVANVGSTTTPRAMPIVSHMGQRMFQFGGSTDAMFLLAEPSPYMGNRVDLNGCLRQVHATSFYYAAYHLAA